MYLMLIMEQIDPVELIMEYIAVRP